MLLPLIVQDLDVRIRKKGYKNEKVALTVTGELKDGTKFREVPR